MDKMDEVSAGSAHGAIVFDLDTLVLNGRRIAFDVLADLLQAKGGKLTPILFSRYVIAPDTLDLAPLLQALNVAEDAAALLEQWQATVQDRLGSTVPKMPDALRTWLDAARARNALIGVVTELPQAKAETIFSQLGLDAETARLCVCPATDRGLREVDTWTRIASTLGKCARHCIAIVTEAHTAKAALAAQMSVIAIPDEYTEFQDFCGANAVAANLKDIKADEYLETAHF